MENNKINKNAICILTIIPHIDFIEFYNNFTNYDIFFIIDDYNYNCKIIKDLYPSINFIQISNNECNNNGFNLSEAGVSPV